MKIATLALTSSIRQSSPFPCAEDNKITVVVTPTVDLYASCSPVVSLGGLTGAATPSGDLNVTYAANNGTLGGTHAASWDQVNGTLTFDLGTVQTATILRSREIVLNFILTNPKHNQSSPTTSLSMQLVDTPTYFHAVATHVSDSMALFDSTALNLTAQTSCPASSGDAHPLLIRSIVVTTFTALRSSKNPCDTLSITVVLRTDGPLFQAGVPQLTLAGLHGSVTASDSSLDMAVTPVGAFKESGNWTNTGGAGDSWDNAGAIGNLLLPLASGAFMKGCVDYTIVFDVTNPVRPQDAASMTLTAPAVISDVAVSNADQMEVVDVGWITASISGTSPGTSTNPCDLTSITVTVTPSIKLFASCVEFLEFTGLVGAMTATTTNFTLHPACSTPFATTAHWNSSGRLKIFLSSDLAANTQHTFSFSL